MTPEQKQQRIEQIRENRRLWYGGYGQLTSDFDFLLSLVKRQEVLPICPDCQQGYVCEHCGKPIGDYYANVSALESVSIQEQATKHDPIS